MQNENKLFYIFGKGKLAKDFIDFLLKNIDKKNIIVIPELPEHLPSPPNRPPSYLPFILFALII